MCTSDGFSCFLSVLFVVCSSVPGLRRTPLDSFQPVASYFCPDISSTASDAWSQCSPVPLRSRVDSPHKKTILAKNNKIAWCLCWGHNLKKGRRSHSLVIRFGSVRCIRAIRVRVDSKIICLTSRSVCRCRMVSCLTHWICFSVSIIRILCNLTFLGILSWITMCNADLAPSGNIALWRLPHTRDQVNAGWSCMTRTSRSLIPAVDWSSQGAIYPSFKGPPCFSLPLGFHIRPFVKINA
jgi:hypothetical protein